MKSLAHRLGVGAPLARLAASGAALGLILLALAGLLAWLEPGFLASRNLVNVVRAASILGLVAIGQALVLIVGGFDLTVGAVVAGASVLLAKVMLALTAAGHGEGSAITLAVLCALAGGALVGGVNGVLIAWFRLSPFMVTLATGAMVSGLSYFVTTGIPIYGMPESFMEWFGQGGGLPLPAVILVWGLVAAGAWLVQSRSRLALHLYATGGNERAAAVSGVNVRRCTLLAYVVSGVLAALVGVMLSARLGSGQANIGAELTLQSIAAAVIAGVSLRGGVGDMGRVVVSVLFLAVLANGMNLLHIDSKLQTVFLGFVLMAAVAAEELSSHRRKLA